MRKKCVPPPAGNTGKLSREFFRTIPVFFADFLRLRKVAGTKKNFHRRRRALRSEIVQDNFCPACPETTQGLRAAIVLCLPQDLAICHQIRVRF
jgi:hypothetical protein